MDKYLEDWGIGDYGKLAQKRRCGQLISAMITLNVGAGLRGWWPTLALTLWCSWVMWQRPEETHWNGPVGGELSFSRPMRYKIPLHVHFMCRVQNCPLWVNLVFTSTYFCIYIKIFPAVQTRGIWPWSPFLETFRTQSSDFPLQPEILGSYRRCNVPQKPWEPPGVDLSQFIESYVYQTGILKN